MKKWKTVFCKIHDREIFVKLSDMLTCKCRLPVRDEAHLWRVLQSECVDRPIHDSAGKSDLANLRLRK